MRILLAVFTFALSFGAAERAHAWCQGCTVVASTAGCSQPCFCPVDVDPAAHALYWDRSCIEVSVMASPGPGFTTAELDAIVDRSFARWTSLDCGGGRAPGFQLRRTEERALCDIAEYVLDEGNSNSIVVVNEGWSERLGHDPAAFALTTTFFRRATGEIIDADMELNEDDWGFAACPEAGCIDGSVDLENTLVHEAGHFFGLAHSDLDRESTMWACAETGETLKRTLAADDIEGICTIYGPDALPEGCRYTPVGGFDPLCADDREGCGCRIAQPGGEPPLALLAFFGLVLYWRSNRRGVRA